MGAIHHSQAAYSCFAAAGITLISLLIWLRADTRLTRQTEEPCASSEISTAGWEWPNERNTTTNPAKEGQNA